MRLIPLVIAILTGITQHFFNPASAQCLSGNYTIGSGGDYATFSLAASDLNSQGICGEVVFNVITGTYDEDFALTDVSGVSSLNTITFQSQSGDPNDVVLQSSGFSDVVVLHGTDYITFKDLTISYTGSGANSTIELQDDSDNVVVSNCILTGGSSTSTANSHSLIYSNETLFANQCDSFILENSILNGAANGVYFTNSSSDNLGSRISGNTFSNQFRNGIYVDDFEAIDVIGNSITNGSNANSSYTAITLNDCNGESKILRNQIASTYIKYGIVLDGEGGAAGNEVLVANNFVSMGGAQPFNQSQGIRIAGCSYVNVYFNNVSNYNSYNTALTCCLFISGTITDGTINVLNNNLSMTGGGNSQTAVYLFSTNNRLDIGVSDHNNYFAPSPSSIAYSSGYLDLLGYQSLLTSDANSISLDPEFTSATDLHVSAVGLIGEGTSISGITEDIDGDVRADPPTIGADEEESPITSISDSYKSPITIRVTQDETILVETDDLEITSGTIQILDLTGCMIYQQKFTVENGKAVIQPRSITSDLYVIRFLSWKDNSITAIKARL